MKRTPLLVVAGAVLAGWATARAIRTLRYSFEDKVVLITGGSRGLGLVLARQLSAKGAHVVLLARDEPELARAKAQIIGLGGEALTIQTDLLERSQIHAAIKTALSRYGRIDILINNAGIMEIGGLDHMRREDYDRAMRLHFWAPLEMMSQVIPGMRRQGGGRIVNISSIGGKLAVSHMAPYTASKFALTGLSDSLRAELARDNIHVTTVCPGMMRTGSHIQARFKGADASEFAWFAVLAGLPGISINAERAAAKILAACRRGQPSLTLTYAARAAIAGNALAPNIAGYIGKFVAQFMPRADTSGGEKRQSGAQSRKRSSVPPWMTYLADRASERNNELPRNGA